MSINAIGSNIPIQVPFGASGASTLTANGVLQGNGVNPVTSITSTINGQTVIGATSAASIFNTLTAGTNISIVNGSNSITIDYTGSGGGVITPWTPIINTSAPGWSVVPTYSVQSGKWVVYGKLMIFYGELTLTSRGTFTGGNPLDRIRIEGLPNPIYVPGNGIIYGLSMLGYNMTLVDANHYAYVSQFYSGPSILNQVTIGLAQGAPSLYFKYSYITNTSRFRFMSVAILL